ncbi:unnamed protein product, partial [Ixodes hexagonus]
TCPSCHTSVGLAARNRLFLATCALESGLHRALAVLRGGAPRAEDLQWPLPGNEIPVWPLSPNPRS